MQTMFRLRVAMIAAGLAGCVASGQGGSPAAAQGGSICIEANRIHNTHVVNDSTIDFEMYDGTVYRNTLPQLCPTLSTSTNGFTFAPTPGSDEVCSNLETIRVNGTGVICNLGAFTPLPKSAQAH